ncbi:MAG: U32 family peptidase [Oscillospiraceae bacterium]|nr:U32 family peptidase [Oscillospiraceae bacterium]
MLELSSPAGSPEGIIAAAQNGADSVYLGILEFNVCTDAENFTFDELGRAVEYCRIRGIKTYLTLNSLASDNELPVIAHQVKEASRYGIDAVILQDFGVMRAVREAVPDLPLHASVHMSVHNLEGVKMAAAMGFSRVTVARELTRKKIAHICRYSPIEIEMFIHGASCMGYSGQCYMSALTGGQSSNRGKCDEPCQINYSTAGHTVTHPLGLKDNCLIRYLTDIEAIGVTSVKIEGRSRRPEYSALVTGAYSKTIHGGKSPTQESIRTMQKHFSQSGFTDGHYVDRRNAEMLGVRNQNKNEKLGTALMASTRKSYLNGEFQRVPIRFVGSIVSGERVKLAAADDKQNTAVVYGPIPEQAFHKELTTAVLQTQLHKTSGTPFICKGVKSTVEPGLTLSISSFNEMRRELLAEILEKRKPINMRVEGEYTPSGYVPDELIMDEIIPGGKQQSESKPENKKQIQLKAPIITVSITRADQLSDELEELKPKLIYIPISEFDYESPILHRFVENEAITVAVALPRVIHDNEKKKVGDRLKRARTLGVSDALVGNLGHIQFAKNHGMAVRGDFGLNVYNSETLYVLQKLGMKSATLSFELRLAEIREMSMPIDTELITYGRLPLMITESCIVRNSTDACTCDSFTGLVDESGALFPVEPEFGCRNILLNSKKLFMADKRRAISTLGIWAQRLCFTTENSIECIMIMKRYLRQNNYTPPGYTRGMYFRSAD